MTKLKKIEKILAEEKVPDYVQDQIKNAIYKRYVKKYDEITTLSLDLRKKLTQELGQVNSLSVISEQKSEQAHKILFKTSKGEKIEAVMTIFKKDKDPHYSLCISSQAGCAQGCTFCATGMQGFFGNLTTEEITDQVLYFLQNNHPIKSISFMGMGEPLANPATFGAISEFTDSDKFGFGKRRISISTVGITENLQKMISKFPQVNITYSLHSPFSEERKNIMPIETRHPMKKIFEILDHHIEKNHRQVAIAYIILKDINDTERHAQGLIDLIKSRGENSYLYHVKLIPYNECETIREYKKTSPKTVAMFEGKLTDAGISSSIRQSFGYDIDAACGMLSGKQRNQQPK